MSDPVGEIELGLEALGERYRSSFAAAATEQELRNANAAILGKKGELTSLLKLMGKVPAERKRDLGERVNAVRLEVEASFEARLAEIEQGSLNAELGLAPFDLTLPGRTGAPRGHMHPVMRVKDEILDIFRSLGFEISWGPEVEFDENNFTKLAFPPDHPATDMQDTFWVETEVAASGDRAGVRRALLRTHTSNVQVREMSSHQPPLAVVSGGAVYRRDADVTHSPMFHQIEGFLVDENVSFAMLKGVLTEFVRRLYGPGTEVRFRPSYFPFVEPGAEVDAGCVFCRPDDGSRSECRVCKGTGWVELLGCGMVHPEVLEHCGIDSERFTGFAFGMGVERVAMIRYGIPDINLLFANDPRFLAQF